LRQAGSDLVGVRAYFVRDGEAHAQRWLARFRRAADSHVVCGVARSELGQLLLASSRGGALDPLDAERPLVRGSVSDPFRDPQIVVEDAAGELLRVAVAREQLARGVALSPALRRPLKVQLLARGPSGPRPLAERILPDSAASPETASPIMPVDRRPPDNSASGLIDRLAALREAHGRMALRDNRVLADVAAEHAIAVCGGGKVAHELTPGSDPEQRLLRAGVKARRVGETVARTRDAPSAFAAFVESPSHRYTLLERDFTDVGIGQAEDSQGRHCAVVLLATWPRFVGR
jgi:uncharacterized protein YkwD